ncbi:MAG: peptidylprolyl isomerase [Chthoniobacterales bacterium]
MKLFSLTLSLAILALLSTASAQLGPDLAVFEIQFGKEKIRETVVIGLYDQDAPQTVSSFKDLINRRFYNGMRFHRAFPGTLVQTGDPYSKRGPNLRSGTGGPGYTIPSEIRKTPTKGRVVAARLPDKINPARNSSGSQFFVCLKALPDLNKQYTVFGEVLEGMEVLERISNSRTDSNDFPLEKIVIRRVTLQPRVPAAAVATN